MDTLNIDTAYTAPLIGFPVARLAGLEPATPGSEAQCSVH